MRVLAIADDLTGALEAGAKFARAGLRSVVFAGDPESSGADAVVLDTETRHLGAEAAARVVEERAAGLSAPLIYKKTDSTLRGNIGAELAALARLHPGARIAYVPAYPALGRTVCDGRLYVDGVPAHLTCFARDPLNPIRDNSVRAAAGPNVEIFDGEDDSDVQRAAGRILHDRFQIFAGPAAIAEAIAHRIAPQSPPPPTWPRIRNCLVVNGSLHERSFQQVQRLEPGSTWRLLQRSIAAGTAPLEAARQTGVMVAERLQEESPDALMVFGGDSAYAILVALGRPALYPIGEVLPGTPVSAVEGRAMHLITKAGGFGDVDLIPKLRTILDG